VNYSHSFVNSAPFRLFDTRCVGSSGRESASINAWNDRQERATQSFSRPSYLSAPTKAHYASCIAEIIIVNTIAAVDMTHLALMILDYLPDQCARGIGPPKGEKLVLHNQPCGLQCFLPNL
jgi:hypothetical protein